ncbi:hypothetical protein DL96DRAFT_1755743 [Flagelloscypha sp. PMI_526]|nr:hypothetical protein DL96DRAFT_1755743 [Flagelloscypha sp. PMI_526]
MDHGQTVEGLILWSKRQQVSIKMKARRMPRSFVLRIQSRLAMVPPLKLEVEPRPFPFQAIDYTAGHLLAYGINAALCRMITCRVDPAVAFGDASPLPARTSEEVRALQGTFISRKTSSIQMQALRRIADLEPDIVWSKVDVAPMRLDADEAHLGLVSREDVEGIAMISHWKYKPWMMGL